MLQMRICNCGYSDNLVQMAKENGNETYEIFIWCKLLIRVISCNNHHWDSCY